MIILWTILFVILLAWTSLPAWVIAILAYFFYRIGSWYRRNRLARLIVGILYVRIHCGVEELKGLCGVVSWRFYRSTIQYLATHGFLTVTPDNKIALAPNVREHFDKVMIK